MSQLTTLLRSLGSLGNGGALANVQATLDDRQREDWLIEGLARRLDATAPPAAAPASRPAHAA